MRNNFYRPQHMLQCTDLNRRGPRYTRSLYWARFLHRFNYLWLGWFKCALFLRNRAMRCINFFRNTTAVNGWSRLNIFDRATGVLDMAQGISIIGYHFGLIRGARQHENCLRCHGGGHGNKGSLFATKRRISILGIFTKQLGLSFGITTGRITLILRSGLHLASTGRLGGNLPRT